jgi:hypothetical protein
VSRLLRVPLFEEAAFVGDRLLARQAGFRVRRCADRVREPRYELEPCLYVGRVPQRLARDARSERASGIERGEEVERAAQPLVDRRGLVVVEDRVDELRASEGVRRDRAVGLESEGTLVQL